MGRPNKSKLTQQSGALTSAVEGGDNGEGPVWDHLWDIPPRLRKQKIKVGSHARHIILVRHADHLDNDGVIALTSQGVIQAKKTAQRLIELDVPINKIITSSMPRAQLTASLIYNTINQPKVEFETSSLLNEGAPVRPNPEIRNWSPNAKDLEKDSFRIEKAFRSFFYRSTTIQEVSSCDILVCHANVIRYLICRVMQFPCDSWLRMTVPHCSLNTISIEPNGKVWLRGFGEYGHLDAGEGSF